MITKIRTRTSGFPVGPSPSFVRRSSNDLTSVFSRLFPLPANTDKNLAQLNTQIRLLLDFTHGFLHLVLPQLVLVEGRAEEETKEGVHVEQVVLNGSACEQYEKLYSPVAAQHCVRAPVNAQRHLARRRHTDMVVRLLWFLIWCASSRMMRCQATRSSMVSLEAFLQSRIGFSSASLLFISSVTPTSLLTMLYVVSTTSAAASLLQHNNK